MKNMKMELRPVVLVIAVGLLAACAPAHFEYAPSESATKVADNSSNTPVSVCDPNAVDDLDCPLVTPPLPNDPPPRNPPPQPPDPKDPADPVDPQDPPPVCCVVTPPPPPPPPPVKKTIADFYQDNGNDKVDILFVDDNSESMDDDQRKMASKFDDFMSAIADLDFHIGVITTDVSTWPKVGRGSLLPMGNGNFVTSQTANLRKNFVETIVRPESIECEMGSPTNPCGSADEQGLKAVQMAIAKRNSDNKGFFRDNADLVIILLTDEDESSRGGSPQATINMIKNTWGEEKKLLTHGVIIAPGDLACMNKQKAGGGRVAHTLQDFIWRTGGSTSSICDADYGKSLSQLSQKIRRMKTSFELASVPKAGSVEVKMTPEGPSNTWSVVGNMVIFSKPPKAGSHIQISYEE